jgi:hypothetical protein
VFSQQQKRIYDMFFTLHIANQDIQIERNDGQILESLIERNYEHPIKKKKEGVTTENACTCIYISLSHKSIFLSFPRFSSDQSSVDRFPLSVKSLPP